MHCRLLLFLVPVLLSSLAMTGTARAGGTPGQICAGAKTKAAGQSARASLACHGKAARGGVDVDATCLAKAAAKLADAFARAETRAGCVTVGDAGTIAALLDSQVGDLAAGLRPVGDANRCAEAKLKATAKKTQRKLGCHAKATGRGVTVDALCLTMAEARFGAAFSKADARPPCLTTTDAADVEALVDGLVAAVVAAIPPASTTTSTSTTPTTLTTTTTAQQCVPFNLACDGSNPCTCGEPGCSCVDNGRSFCLVAPSTCSDCPAGFFCVPCVICVLHGDITGQTGEACVLPCS